MAVTNKAKIYAYVGAPGSGKSLAAKAKLKAIKPKNLVIYDPLDEWGAFAPRLDIDGESLASIGQKLKKAFRASPVKFRVCVPSDKAKQVFDWMCGYCMGVGEITLVGEELNLVAPNGGASDEWKDCILRGRHKGLSIIGISQRPAIIDKNFWGCANLISTGRLNSAGDVKQISDVLMVPKTEILQLKPLDFIERDTDLNLITRGVRKIPQK